jgi:hypothetical protein
MDRGLADFLQRFLGCEEEDMSMPVEDTRSSILALSRVGDTSSHVSTQKALVAGHIIFRYRLLDVLARALDLPRHVTFTHVQRTVAPAIDMENSRWKSVCLFVPNLPSPRLRFSTIATFHTAELAKNTLRL